MTINISRLTSEYTTGWDNYVRSAEGGLPQHLSGWRDVLFKTNRYETHYLIAVEDEKIVGILPLFIVRSLLVGNKATTMPGGLCADDERVAVELIARGMKTAARAGAKQFMLADTHLLWPVELETFTNHVHWLLGIDPDSDIMWKKLHSNIRRQVRIAHRNELIAKIDRVGVLLDDFYDVFSRFTHQVGTPVFGRNFLEHTVNAFPNMFNILVIYKENRPVGGYFQLEMNQTIYGVWGATLKDYLSLRPVYLAFWEIIKYAVEGGFKAVDMGRSPVDSQASRFKGQWGGTAKPVYQQIAVLSADQSATDITNQLKSNSKFQLFMQIWPWLPLPLTRYLGPKLRRHVPFA